MATEVIIKRKTTHRFTGVGVAAKKLGVTQYTLSRYLHGDRELSREKTRRIRIVDVEVEDSHA